MDIYPILSLEKTKNGVKKVCYLYDALGRRVKSIDFDKTYRVTDSKIFIHSGDRLLEEFKSDNAIRGYKVDSSLSVWKWLCR